MMNAEIDVLVERARMRFCWRADAQRNSIGSNRDSGAPRRQSKVVQTAAPEGKMPVPYSSPAKCFIFLKQLLLLPVQWSAFYPTLLN